MGKDIIVNLWAIGKIRMRGVGKIIQELIVYADVAIILLIIIRCVANILYLNSPATLSNIIRTTYRILSLIPGICFLRYLKGV